MLRSLSIVVPTYNEEDRVVETLSSIIRDIKHITDDYEIIVSDDGSKDKTVKKIKDNFFGKVIVVENEHKGKGATLKSGVKKSSKDYILFMDADNSANITQINRFLENQPADIWVGSRILKNKTVCYDSLDRLISRRLFSLLVYFLINVGIKDTQCGFKMFKNSVAKELFSELTEDGFVFDVELLSKARQKNKKIIEVPITWRKKKGGAIRIFRDGFEMFRGLIRIRKINKEKA
jgi:dolichyl-phosphate beta-glucosyltransferase